MVSINELPTYIIILMVVGVLAAVGIMIQDELRGSMGSTSSFSVVNETIAIAAAGTALAQKSLDAPTSLAITNTTDGYTVNLNSTSYNINTTGTATGEQPLTYTIYLNNTQNPDWEGANINLSYSGNRHSTQGNILRNSSQGIANITAQIPTVGTVVGVSLIVVVILLLFVTLRRREY